MTLTVNHSTPADGTFSATGAAAWDASHTLTGAIDIANGGTGQTTQTTAFDALAPTTTKGDLIAYNGTDNVRVAAGTNGVIGVATAKIFRGKLEEKALQDCEKKGGTGCQIWFTYDDNHCATVGQAEGTNRLYRARTTAGEVKDIIPVLVPGSRKALGRKKVVDACRADGFPESQCKIIYQDCRRLNLP